MNLAEEEREITVKFYDLDPMNVVWHGNYVKFAEEARCSLLDKIGYRYEEMRADGVMYPVAKMDMKFIKPAVFGQKLTVKTILEEIEPSLNIKYIIKDSATGETLFKANTMQICVDVLSGRSLYEAPEKFRKGIECLKDV